MKAMNSTRPPTSKVIISSSKNSGSILASAAVHQGASPVLAKAQQSCGYYRVAGQ